MFQLDILCPVPVKYKCPVWQAFEQACMLKLLFSFINNFDKIESIESWALSPDIFSSSFLQSVAFLIRCLFLYFAFFGNLAVHRCAILSR